MPSARPPTESEMASRERDESTCTCVYRQQDSEGHEATKGRNTRRTYAEIDRQQSRLRKGIQCT